MKNKRIPLAVKMYILIIVMILFISGLLIVTSNAGYRKAVFDPFNRKLSEAELPMDELEPIIRGFAGYCGSEELDQLHTVETDDVDMVIWTWMEGKPSCDPEPNDDYARSLMSDWMKFQYRVDEVRMGSDLDKINITVQKGSDVFEIYGCSKSSYFEYSMGDLGIRVPEDGRSPSEFSSPALTGTDEKTELVRCTSYDLGDDGTVLVWTSFDLTEEIREHSCFLFRAILFTAIHMVFVTLLFMFLIRRFVTRPIRDLAEASNNFTPEEDGTFSPDKISHLDIRNRDEIGDLNRDITSMQERIVENTENLARMTADKERVLTELNLARQIQAQMLPNAASFPVREEFDLFAAMTPALEVGGDFYDFFLIDDDHLALVIADVSGKGIPAALFMAVSRTIIRNQLMSGSDPAQALEFANRQIYAQNESMMFVTVWLAVLELSTGKGLACNAGHEHPAVRRADGVFELLRYKHDRFVGFTDNAVYHNRPFTLSPGDCLIVYTDGVPEANNESQEMFGEERLTETLNRNASASPKELIGRLEEAISEFAAGVPQFDDITMLGVQYNGRKEKQSQ